MLSVQNDNSSIKTENLYSHLIVKELFILNDSQVIEMLMMVGFEE